MRLNQRNEAQTNAIQAKDNFETSERIRLAAQAQIALDNGEGGDLPALLALRSLQFSYSPEADAALLQALDRGFTQQQYLGHTDSVRDVSLSPDGRTVLTASADNTARLWDAQTGQELQQFIGHTQIINVAEFSPDSLRVLTVSLDGTARLWDTQTGEELRQFIGHTGGLTGADFSPDGQTIVTSGYDNVARLWDAQLGEELRQFTGHADLISRVDFSPNGRYIATASADNTAKLWDVETGEELRQFLGHTDFVGSARFSADGQHLITESADLTARLWDIQTGLELRRFVGHTEILNDVAISPDGRYVLTGSLDKTARLWDTQTGEELRQFIGHTGGVGTVAFSGDGQFVLTGSFDRSARLWDVWLETEPRRLEISLNAKEQSGFSTASLTPDNDYVFTTGQAYDASVVRFWALQSGAFEKELTLDVATINDHALSPNGDYLLTGSADNQAQLWDTEMGHEVQSFTGHTGSVLAVAFSIDGQRILTGSADNTARLWDVETGQEIQTLIGHTNAILSASFSSDGQYILTASADQSARLWDMQTGQQLQHFTGHLGSVLDVAISVDGNQILTSSADKTARLWDAQTGQIIQSFIGHSDQVTNIAFSPDGHTILTGSVDQTARLWDIQTGQTVRQLVGHISPLRFVGFSTDGQHLLSGDTQSAYIWRRHLDSIVDFTCSQLSHDLSDTQRAFYNLASDTPTCAAFTEAVATVAPTWTPASIETVSVSDIVLEPLVQSAAEEQPDSSLPSDPDTIEFVFLNDAANLLIGAPMQDVFIEVADGQIERPQDVAATTLSQPLFRSTELIEPDFLEEPFEVGPYEKGEPLDLTLEEWLAATGQGTYTVIGNRAVVELSFQNLIPNGVYTLWCSELHLPPNTKINDRACGASDGSENVFNADDAGNMAVTMEIDTVPPAPEGKIYPLAVAYHSDGQTWGAHPGDFGYNVHVQLFFELSRPVAE